MKQPTPRPVDRHAEPGADPRSPSATTRRGWFRRLGQYVVDRKLDALTQGLVRREKYASAMIMSLRIARELEEPLRNLDQYIAELDRLAEREPEIRRLAAVLRENRQAILGAILRLGEIEPPVGVDSWSSEGRVTLSAASH